MNDVVLYAPTPRFTPANLAAWTSLLRVLAVRNFRVRFLRLRLGLLWAVLQPTVQALVLAVVFVKIFRVSIPHFPLYVLSGVMTWACFQQCVMQSATASIENAPLIKKVPVPVTIFPLAAVGGQLIAFAFQSVILLAFGMLSGTIGPTLLLFPLAVLLQTLLGLGIGLIGGAFLPAVRDVRLALETGLLLAFYATPIVYDPANLASGVRDVVLLNPMAGVMQLHRAAFLNRPIDGTSVLCAVGGSLVCLLLGLWLYHRRSDTFADLL